MFFPFFPSFLIGKVSAIPLSIINVSASLLWAAGEPQWPVATKFFSGKSWDFTMFFLETKHQTSGVFNVWGTQIFLIDPNWCYLETLDTKLMQHRARRLTLPATFWHLVTLRSNQLSCRRAMAKCCYCWLWCGVCSRNGWLWMGNFRCCFQHFLIFSTRTRTSSVSFCFILLEKVWA
jgi:hypothetical protein